LYNPIIFSSAKPADERFDSIKQLLLVEVALLEQPLNNSTG